MPPARRGISPGGEPREAEPVEAEGAVTDLVPEAGVDADAKHAGAEVDAEHADAVSARTDPLPPLKGSIAAPARDGADADAEHVGADAVETVDNAGAGHAVETDDDEAPGA